MEDHQASDDADHTGRETKEVERERHETHAEDSPPVSPPKEFLDLVERVDRIETMLTTVMNKLGSLSFASQQQVTDLGMALQDLAGNANLKGAMDLAGEIEAIKSKLRGLVV